MKGTEAEYVIPLRKEVMKAPKYQRTKKAMIAIREFLQHHTKSENVLIGKQLNEAIQQYGRKHVVPKIKVRVIKDEDKYKAELIGFPIELDKDKKSKEEKKDKKEVKTENLDAKKETDKEKAEEMIEKSEIKKQDKATRKQQDISRGTESKKHGKEMFRAGDYPGEIKK